jgi:hypothetical protein
MLHRRRRNLHLGPGSLRLTPDASPMDAATATCGATRKSPCWKRLPTSTHCCSCIVGIKRHRLLGRFGRVQLDKGLPKPGNRRVHTSRLPAAKPHLNPTSSALSLDHRKCHLSVFCIAAGHRRQWTLVQTDFLRPFQNLLVEVAVAYADVRCMQSDVYRDDSTSPIVNRSRCSPCTP